MYYLNFNYPLCQAVNLTVNGTRFKTSSITLKSARGMLPEPGAHPPDMVQAQYPGKDMGGYMLSGAELPEGEFESNSIRLVSPFCT